MVLKYIEHVLESGWVKPFSIPNYPTKTCVLASTAFAIQACGLYDFGSNSGLLAGLTLLAITLRLSCQTMDPYERFESLTCHVFFGKVIKIDDKASKKVMIVELIQTFNLISFTNFLLSYFHYFLCTALQKCC